MLLLYNNGGSSVFPDIASDIASSGSRIPQPRPFICDSLKTISAVHAQKNGIGASSTSRAVATRSRRAYLGGNDLRG